MTSSQIKVFKYKLVPNARQRLALQSTINTCRDIWNMALEQRKYRRTHWTVQCRELTELKQSFPEYKKVHVHILQNVVKKLHHAFEGMWMRGAGFPRFKSKRRYHSFSFNNVGFSLSGNRLSLSKIGNIKVRLSRVIPEDAVIKSLTIKQTVSGWYACFSRAKRVQRAEPRKRKRLRNENTDALVATLRTETRQRHKSFWLGQSH